MPYDPDWDPEGEPGKEPGNHGSVLCGHGWAPENNAEEISSRRWEEAPGQDVNAGLGRHDLVNGMDLDEPEPGPRRSRENAPDATPGSRLPFPGADLLAKQAVAEIVVHSSPRKPAHVLPPEDSAGEKQDEADVVKSDIVGPKRRGRPPARATGQTPANMPPAGPRPPFPPASAAVPTPPPAGPALPPTTIAAQPKKRGRPVGWRLGHGSYAAMRAGITPAAASATPRPKPKKPTGEPKPRGRPGRKPAPTARQIYLKLNPHFLSFRCEWEGCPAELQNLETLRKHIHVVHGKRQASGAAAQPAASSSSATTIIISCRWASCTVEPFRSLEDFAAHAEAAHLAPFLWHVGDGPRNTTPSAVVLPLTKTGISKRRIVAAAAVTSTTDNLDDDADPPLPRYLFNADGEQVTPSIRDQQTETEEDRRRRAQRVQRVLALQDQNAPAEPELTPREMQAIAKAARERQEKRKMLEEYAERLMRGGEEVEGWVVR
ncbi:hypothetical protein VTJ83DRAFT_6554 [Remersonia thermophila]|uniref:C2H2-type domain-containing protein n=1 Tax=Remersonia thermophila TaxID=72144 RepID=A0ABR4D7A4_9PEZI